MRIKHARQAFQKLLPYLLVFTLGVLVGLSRLSLNPAVWYREPADVADLKLLDAGRQIQLALERYRLEHGRYPARFDELMVREPNAFFEAEPAGKYIHKLPQNPYGHGRIKQLADAAASEAGAFHYGLVAQDNYVLILYLDEFWDTDPGPIQGIIIGGSGIPVSYDTRRKAYWLSNADMLGWK